MGDAPDFQYSACVAVVARDMDHVQQFQIFVVQDLISANRYSRVDVARRASDISKCPKSYSPQTQRAVRCG